MRDSKIILPDPKRRRLITGLGALGASAALTGCDSLSRNDRVQDLLGATDRLTRAAQRLVTSRESLAREYANADIAPTMRANGSTDPSNEDYRRHTANDFADWRLRIDGLVRQPGDFSIDDLKAMPSRTQITRHDCVEGWSCIGQWTGAVLGDVLDRVRPTAARYVVFHCADNIYDSPVKYYESIDMVEALSADPARLRPQRRPPAHRQRRAAAPARGAPARLQDGEIRHAHRTGGQLRLDPGRQRRLLGGSRLRVVGRHLTPLGGGPAHHGHPIRQAPPASPGGRSIAVRRSIAIRPTPDCGPSETALGSVDVSYESAPSAVVRQDEA